MKIMTSILFAIILFSCSPKSEGAQQLVELATGSSTRMDSVLSHNVEVPYDLKAYSDMYVLDPKLIEISGLSYDSETDQFLAINDEKGNIYIMSASDMSISKEIDFGGKGDYEGIELVDGVAYVVKSNGTIYTYNIKTNTDGINHKTVLTSANDIEGLATHPSGKGLLLACKEQSNIEGVEKLKKTKCLYYFDLSDHKLQEKPFLSIADEDLLSRVEELYGSTGLSKTALKKLDSRIKSFSPSAVAYHPIDGTLYVLSSVGNSLITLSATGKILTISFLDENIHQQPEGLCFDSKGNMYISNEGRGLVAKIYQYKYQGSL